MFAVHDLCPSTGPKWPKNIQSKNKTERNDFSTLNMNSPYLLTKFNNFRNRKKSQRTKLSKMLQTMVVSMGLVKLICSNELTFWCVKTWGICLSSKALLSPWPILCKSLSLFSKLNFPTPLCKVDKGQPHSAFAATITGFNLPVCGLFQRAVYLHGCSKRVMVEALSV